MTLEEAVVTANKFNDEIFTNTPEMVAAVEKLVEFADMHLKLYKDMWRKP